MDPCATASSPSRTCRTVQSRRLQRHRRGVDIGDGTWIGPHVVIEGATRIGRDNRIFQFASIGAAPQDLKFAGEPSAHNRRSQPVPRIRHDEPRHAEAAAQRASPTTTCYGFVDVGMTASSASHECSRITRRSAATSRSAIRCLSGFSGIHQFCHGYAFIAARLPVNGDVPPFVMAADRPPSRTESIRKGEASRLLTEQMTSATPIAFSIACN